MTPQNQIHDCLKQIEKKLNWGSSSQWTNQDFELLAEEIFSKTGTNLSLTTLKRIWGKVDYQSQPSMSTLNVLAQYLGYAHWRAFQNQSIAGLTQLSETERTPKRRALSNLKQKVAILSVLVIAISSLFFFIDRRQVFFNADEIAFTSKKVSTGLPNSVVFEYDLSKVIADSFFLQQSWDSRRRVQISQHENTHTSFYYHPGYFHAKLMANDQVVKEHEVLVESDGWTGMIVRFPEPVYINKHLTQDGMLTADLSDFDQTKTIYQDKDFWIDYYHVQDMGEIDANNFSFRCKIKNNSNMGSICHESRISVICTRGRFNIPLSIPGCVSNLFLTLGNSYFNGKEYDLSPLGCEIGDWVEFELVVSDKNCTILLNDETKLEELYSIDLGKIVGFKFKFNGVGEVDDVVLKDNSDTIVFSDSFEAI